MYRDLLLAMRRHKTETELASEQRDRAEKARELLDGAGVIALLFGIPAVSVLFLAIALPRWFG